MLPCLLAGALGLPQQQDLLTAPRVLDPPQASQQPVDLVYTWVGEPSTDARVALLGRQIER